VRIFKKASGQQTVSLDDCIITAIAWGWIDGKGRSLDEVSYLIRLTPRRSRSIWSQKNRARAEALIASGRMTPFGMVHVDLAREDGRWDRAYAGSADMVIPDDFIEEVEKKPAAKAHFEKLDRRGLFLIYLGLQTATRVETRTKRIARYIEQLAISQSP
jgi:uncharacterized protein YdeI (YjbR/CyaY-like superfamily)